MGEERSDTRDLSSHVLEPMFLISDGDCAEADRFFDVIGQT